MNNNDNIRNDPWPITGHRNFIPYYFVDGFSEKECDIFVNLMEQNKQFGGKGETQGEVPFNIRDCYVNFVPSNQPSTKWIYEKISKLVFDINEQFFKYDISEIETIQFTTYLGNQKSHYGQHVDHLTIGSKWRKLSCVIQLSDPNDYEGGELILYLPSKFVVPKKRGTFIVFPSFLPHAVFPVTKGVRYSSVSWILGPPYR